MAGAAHGRGGRPGELRSAATSMGIAGDTLRVLDARGTRGAVLLPAKLRALTADRSTVWGAIEDDLDVSYLVRSDVAPAS